jgi:signal transduction histidine kinase
LTEVFARVKNHSQASRLLSNVIDLHRIEINVILAISQTDMENFAQRAETLIAEIEEHFDYLQQLADQDLARLAERARQAFNQYKIHHQQIIRLALTNSNVRAQQLANGPGQQLVIEMERLLTDITDASSGEMDSAMNASRGDYIATRNVLLSASVLGLALAIGIALLLGRGVVGNIRKLTNYAREVQVTADLTKAVPALGNDEIGSLGQSFEYMRQALYRQNNELAMANQHLDEKNREIEQFVYTVSHDLRSPLVTCKGFIGLLREDIAKDDRENVLDDARRIESASDQMIHIIDDLLEISRIGRKAIVWQPVDTAAMLNELQQQLDERLQQAGVVLDIQADIPPAAGDESALRRAFENLLSNALKYACVQPDAKISVGGFRNRSEVRYFVKDNGPGIDARYHKKIFDLFQRLDNSTEGTGLGLASVAKTMQVHKGRVWVESAPGEGATFWLALPYPPLKT